MASTRQLKSRVKSVKGTRQITKAMQLVAASKMRKAQERMLASRPYAKCIREVIAHLTKRKIDYEHPYLVARTPQRIGVIVLATDRGLCGGLNTNLFRLALEKILQWQAQQITVTVCAIGAKAELFFKKHNIDIITGTAFLGDNPRMKELIGPIKVLLDAYEAHQVDQIFLLHNEFINTMTQTPQQEMLLPIVNGRLDGQTKQSDYIYEPTPEALLDALLKRYVESIVYQSVVENLACEQAARMVAMKNASDNAADLIDEFQLMYNKARQAAITKELTEIVSGAAAV